MELMTSLYFVFLLQVMGETTADCDDKITYCVRYNLPVVCVEPWLLSYAKDKCAYTCNLCPNGTADPRPCVDVRTDCHEFNIPKACADKYSWARSSCAVTCHTCHYVKSPFPDRRLTVCEGDNAAIPWTVNHTQRDVSGTYVWTRHVNLTVLHRCGSDVTTQGVELARGTFTNMSVRDDVVDVITSDGRLVFGSVYEMGIKKTVREDAGNYTLTVDVLKKDEMVATRDNDTVTLTVLDLPAEVDGGHLQTSVSAVRVNVNHDPQWTLRVSCGTISQPGLSSHNQSGASVVWTTPAGETVPSTDNANGTFFLLPPVPLLWGRYTCRLACGAIQQPALAVSPAYITLTLQDAHTRVAEAFRHYYRDLNLYMND